MRFFLIASIAVVAFCSEARAWGDEGHKIVCEIAFRLAQPDTRAAIRRLIRSDTEFDNFSDSCVFPDHPRIRAPEHFINLPRDSKGLASDDRPAAPTCVLTAILNDSKNLTSSTEKNRDRLLALKSLGHWVGDIHQPLHVSFEDDRGGNKIRVSGQCSGNLHGTGILPRSARSRPRCWRGRDGSHRCNHARDENPMERVRSTCLGQRSRCRRSCETGYCEMHGPSCDLPAGNVTISAEYLAANEPLVKEQLQKAGVRLARLLDEAFTN